jgi:CRP-like cAMP-binding protein
MSLSSFQESPSPFKSRSEVSRTELLKSSLLFKDVNPATLQELERTASSRTYSKGSLLFSQGDQANHFYLIKSGWVKLFRETLDGDEAVIDVLNDLHLLGETAIFENGQHNYSAEVIEESVLLSFPSHILKQAVENDSKMALNMLAVMSRFRRLQSNELEHRTVQNAPQRIGCFLLRLCNPNSKGAITLHLPYDKTLIAARLGMQPETFSRALARLKEETGIRVRGSTVELDSINQLSCYSCNACSESYPCDDLL